MKQENNQRHKSVRLFAGVSKTALLLGGVSTVALSALVAGPVSAQTAAGAPAQDEVVVTAIRRSLKNAQQIKQTADVIVDSVTAEDIGALPDRSVTEALQRIPGVAINRFAAGVDPDHFSVEGSGVTVRGLNMTRSELNGRDTFSANNGRALSFADVPSELMAGVDVYKNPDSSMIEGGIAGTVNLRTRLPFDSKKRVIAFSLEGSYGDFAKKTTPTFSGLISDSWDTSIGKIGLMLNLVDSKLTTRSDGAQISNYACRTNVVTNPGNVAVTSSAVDCNGAAAGGAGIWYPRGAAIRSSLTDRERKGIGFAAQWKSTDETMLAAFQYLRSETEGNWTEHAIEIATDNVAANGDSWPVYNTSVTVDDQGRFTSGVLTSNSTGWRADQGGGGDKRTPKYGLQSNNIRRDQAQTYLTEDYGLNLKWTPNDHWGFKFDLQHVNSTVDVMDNTIWSSSYQDVKIKLNGNDIPIISFQAPTALSATGATTSAGDLGTYYAAGTTYASLANNFWRSAMDHFEQSEGTENSVRADAEYLFDDNNWVQALDFGVRWSERDQTTRFSNYNWGVLSESWGSGGQVWMDETLTGLGTNSATKAEAYKYTNFMGGEVANPVGTNGVLFYSGNTVDDYAGYKAFALAVGDTWRTRNSGTCRDGVTPAPQNWVPASMRCDVVPGTNFRLNEINPVNEKNKAAYVMLKYKHSMDNGWKIGGNVGLRYTETNRVSTGYVAFPKGTFSTDADCAAATTVSTFCSLSIPVRQQARNWANGAITPISGGADYRYLLPSFNLKVQPDSKLVLRLGLSETLTPPEMGLVRAYYNLAVDTANATSIQGGMPTGTVTVGNPALKPTHSENLDLSAEWYFAPVGSLTLAVFNKTLTDVVTNYTERRPFTNNGATFDIVVTQPGNSPDKGHVSGFELSYQQTYDFLPGPLSGLGVNANYAYIKSKGVKQSTLSATDPDVAAGRVTVIDTSLLPLQGLSKDNANFTVFYEKYGLSARLAYNYRSDFLVTVRDVIVPFQPIMQAGGGQLDGSLFYNVTPKIKIGVQGQNLTNQITRTKAIIGVKGTELVTAGRSWFMNDRRVNFVIRGAF